jgi:hypothetical protein
MRRRVFRIRKWLLPAVAVAALAFAPGAHAVLYAGDDGIVGAKPLVVTTGGGFDWADAAAGVGVGVGVALGCVGVVQLVRNRRRLATLL